MSLKYRNFEINDFQVINKFMKGLYSEDTEGKTISDKKITNTLNTLINKPEYGNIVVIECNNLPIGYCLLINYLSNEYGGIIIHIDELFIEKNYRNKGFGSKFIKDFISDNSYKAVAFQLEVMPSNIKALKLYKNLGFVNDKNTHLIYENEILD